MSNVKALLILSVLLTVRFCTCGQCPVSDDSLLIYCVDLKKQNVKFYWKDEKNQPFKNFENLKTWLNKKGQQLLFAANGGMYKTDNSPLGLFIDSGKTITPLNRASASGNFYLKPNGVFYISKGNTATICVTEKFKASANIIYATQSGPMLVINGKIHPEFNQGSSNVNVRNGVGLLPNGQLIFIMSKKPVNLYDFANSFLRSGCKNALYLDGFVSRTYLPNQNWQQLDGNFGVIIAEASAEK
jgi:uncharacterized protein YigE (DUF2233 family)